MKKAGISLALVVGLTACGQGGSFGSQSDVTPGIGSVGKITLTQIYSKTTGAYTGYTSTITQPILKFAVSPGSLGVTVTDYSVQVLDSAGANFGGNDGLYVRDGLAFRIPSGYTCPNSTNDQCAGKDKVPTAREVAFPDSMAFLKDSVTSELNSVYYTTDVCENLAMAITFRGFDDLKRPWISKAVTRADVSTTCNRELEDK
ncbi:hypothetical protein GCM10017783_18210 [Deinococcus piscis]|uniref:Lipoprotein n=1 Tax=Deinococcus piscis TaxID=394230 RepID=A0ABQ3KBE2_9DEIO|nr:hypothetical protein [Deinococcus piscis]GHG06009.1 hypothetical protein GCM10017783_18210 [Deinococcus piscis]